MSLYMEIVEPRATQRDIGVLVGHAEHRFIEASCRFLASQDLVRNMRDRSISFEAVVMQALAADWPALGPQWRPVAGSAASLGLRNPWRHLCPEYGTRPRRDFLES